MKKRTSKPPAPSPQPQPQPQPQPLTHIVAWSQKLAREVLQPGDLAVDLTAGKGRDTYILAQAVGPEGQIVAFDLQADAIEQTAELLQEKGLEVTRCEVEQPLPRQNGILLVQACHSSLARMLNHPAKVIIANLGYLPGGDRSIITRPDSTLAALEQSLDLLSPGGRLIVTVYPVHEGGAEESKMVTAFFSHLPVEKWQVLSLMATNSKQAPYLLVAECKPLKPQNA